MQIKSPLFNIQKQAATPEEAWKTALDFEKSVVSSFLQTFLSQTGEEGKLFGSEHGGMFNNLYADKLAESMTGKFGIAEQVVKTLLKEQETI